MLKEDFEYQVNFDINITYVWSTVLVTIAKAIKVPLTLMGFLALGSAHARPSAWPSIDMNGQFGAQTPSNLFPITYQGSSCT
jgi:hypothetical protein